jgi:hypothetical protein
VTMRRWIIGIAVVIGLTGAFAQPLPPITEPLFDTAWPTWGRDLRRSHFASDFAGPNNPVVLWFRQNGALEEPAIFEPEVWVPQHPATGLRYTRYTRYDGASGRITGSFGSASGVPFPFWGVPSTPIFMNAAVFFVDTNGNLLLVLPWRALMLSGGQYESVFFSPGPPLPGGGQAPDFSVTLRGSPAYRTSFGAFTDGNFIYPVYADNLGNIFVIRFAWRVVLDGSGNVQSVTPLYLQRRVYRGLPAALGTVSSDRAGSILLLGFHDGLVLALSTSIPLALPIEWLTTFQTLSGGMSDSVDRPIAVTSDESTAIVCGSNSGRVYGVSLADGSRQWEYQAGGAIMGGPSIGPDPGNGNEDTVYIVVRHSPTQSAIHAIRASDGAGKWVRVLPNISRCTPTIDRNGVLYIGDDRGFLYAINPNNSVKWQLYLGAPIRVAPVIGEFDFRGNPTTFMFVAASNRFLYAIVDRSVLSTQSTPGAGGVNTAPRSGGAQ